jgi:diguanylate cyclase (GGDEF)-like protein
MYFLSLKIKSILEKYNKQIKQKQQKLFIQANFDTLTGLHNRQHFLLELKESLIKLKRNKEKLAVLFIDIDHFKEINDSQGHLVGDEVLKIIANRLKTILREEDIIARFGGDEFVILLDNITNSNNITELTERILKILKKPISIDDIEHYVSGSIGISVAPDDSTDINQLIKYADTAMYRSKQQGKDRFNFYNISMTEDANQRLAIKTALHNALKNNEFELYFQPQITNKNQLFGEEVLLRWNHPQKGIISPFHFIPIAVELGIIDKIDLWVIENSIIQYQKWVQLGYNPGIISCNITIYHLEKGEIFNQLKELLKKYNFNPQNLNLEVTEEGIMKNPQKSIKILKQIKEIGININIDDFGTGYSSLAYLKKLPISKLKIDRNFIKDIPDDKDDMMITKTIINLAKNLNLSIIAEGVETKEQQQFVFDNGCDNIQGYFYSKPINSIEFEERFLK